jgi:ferredoxin
VDVTAEAELVELHIDSTRCQGHARCNMLCTEVFGLDEEGFAFVIEGSDLVANRSKVESAAANCPEHAIVFSP